MIHIVIDGNKEKFLEWANSVIDVGAAYSERCISVLIERYGINPKNVSTENMREMSTGYLIGCVTRQTPPMAPKDFIEERLAELSDYGLSKLGLTRSDYDKHS